MRITNTNGLTTMDSTTINHMSDENPDGQSTSNPKKTKNANPTLNSQKTMENNATLFALLIFGMSICVLVLLAYMTVAIVDKHRKKNLGEYTVRYDF